MFRFSFFVLFFAAVFAAFVSAVFATEVVTTADGRILAFKLTAGESLEFHYALSPEETVLFANGGKYEGQQFGNMSLSKVKNAARLAGFNNCFVLENASFKNAVFEQSRFLNVFFANCGFESATLKDTFLCADEQCRFDNAVINGSCILGLTAEQLKQTQSYKTKNLTQCKLYGSVFDKIDFSGFNMVGAGFAPHPQNYYEFGTLVGEYRGAGYFFSRHPEKKRMEQRYRSGNFLNGSNFTGADLRESFFARTDLEACNFTKANLRKARFAYAVNLKDANFTDADIDGAEFEQVLRNPIKHDTTWIDLYQISREQLQSTASYKKKKLLGLKLHSMDLRNLDFSGFNLTDTQFISEYQKPVDLTGTKWDGAIISGCSFFVPHKDKPTEGYAAAGLTAEQIKSTWNYKNNRMDSVVLPPEIEKQLGIKKENSK